MEVVKKKKKSGVSAEGWWSFRKSSQGHLIPFTANRKCWKSIWTWTMSPDRVYSLSRKSLQKLRSQYLKIPKASQVLSLLGYVCVSACVWNRASLWSPILWTFPQDRSLYPWLSQTCSADQAASNSEIHRPLSPQCWVKGVCSVPSPNLLLLLLLLAF